MKPTIFIIGDSTAASKLPEKRPESGWGEHLHHAFSDEVAIENHAVNGRSTKSFIDEGRFDIVKAAMKEGDFLLIQFGHNDQKKEDPSRYTEPFGAFQENLRCFIMEARAKKAIPVLLTPMTRRNFMNGEVDTEVVRDYYKAAKAVGEELDVPTVDMLGKTIGLLKEMGEEASAALYLHLEPGEHPNYPDGVIDNTHFNQTGAEQLAELVAEELNKKVTALKPYYTKERKEIH